MRDISYLPDLPSLIQTMRVDDQNFVFANPLVEAEDAWMTVTDQFIAGFSMKMSCAEIDALNAQNNVEFVNVISGQENVFLLRTGPGSGLDALSAANLYQESGIAICATPDFIRLTR